MILLALSAVAAAGLSQPQVPKDSTASSDIIVRGVRSREQALHNFIGAVTPAPIGGRIARFELKACPGAVGLTDAQNEQIRLRLRQVAKASGVPLAPDGCAPNALVIAVDNKEEFLKAFQRRYPVYFSDAVGGPMRPPKANGPAVAWQIEGVMSGDHIAASYQTPASGGGSGTFAVVSSMDASRLRPTPIPHFLACVLIVEAKALAGLTTTQLADYAALRLYARTDPSKLKPGTLSILGALDAPAGAAVPMTLTKWDYSFLKGLYASDDRQYEAAQRGEIERYVQRETRQ